MKIILPITIFPDHLWIFLSGFFSSTNISFFWLLVLFLLLLSSLALNVSLWLNARKFQKYKEPTDAEAEIEDLKALPYGFPARVQMEQQVRDISSNNRLLVSLLERLRQIEAKATAAQLLQIKKMRKMLEQGLQAKEDWQRFLVLFRSCETDFWAALQARHPDLRPAELRMVALFRLDMPQEEIARLLHVSEDGVKKAVYRLRKKMELPPEINFRQYLNEELFRTGLPDPE